MITTSVFIFNFQATEDGGGSPVDVAKSYMRSRLPWGSPAANTSEFRSPSPAGMQLIKEGTPFPYSAGNFSSSKVQCILIFWSKHCLKVLSFFFVQFSKKEEVAYRYVCLMTPLKVMHMHSDFGYQNAAEKEIPFESYMEYSR